MIKIQGFIYIYIYHRSLGFPHLTILSEIYTLTCVSRSAWYPFGVPKSRYTVSRFQRGSIPLSLSLLYHGCVQC